MYIDFPSLWKMLNLGVIADWEKRVVTIRLGPFTMEKVPLPRLKAFAADPAILESALDTLFVRHSAMWQDLRREDPREVQASLERLSKEALEVAKKFDASSKQADRDIASRLRTWSGSAEIKAKQLKTAIDMESDPADTGMDTTARDDMDAVLVELRKECYPWVEFLATLLPPGSAVGAKVLQLLADGKATLIQEYSQAPSSIPNATAELEG